MGGVLLVEDDTLLRELMRDQLLEAGYYVRAVATVRHGLAEATQLRPELVLLGARASVRENFPSLLALQATGARMVALRTSFGTTPVVPDGVALHPWSPFERDALRRVVAEALDPRSTPLTDTEPPTDEESELRSGSFPSGSHPHSPQHHALSALEELVLEATGGRK